jgi:hypothetical protein
MSRARARGVRTGTAREDFALWSLPICCHRVPSWFVLLRLSSRFRYHNGNGDFPLALPARHEKPHTQCRTRPTQHRPTNVIKTDVVTSSMLHGWWTDDRIAATPPQSSRSRPAQSCTGQGQAPLYPTAPWHVFVHSGHHPGL